MDTPCPDSNSLQIANTKNIAKAIGVFQTAIESLGKADLKNEDDRYYVNLFSSYLQSLQNQFVEFQSLFEKSANEVVAKTQSGGVDDGDDALRGGALRFERCIVSLS